jgi:hypothetical protein
VHLLNAPRGGAVRVLTWVPLEHLGTWTDCAVACTTTEVACTLVCVSVVPSPPINPLLSNGSQQIQLLVLTCLENKYFELLGSVTIEAAVWTQGGPSGGDARSHHAEGIDRLQHSPCNAAGAGCMNDNLDSTFT